MTFRVSYMTGECWETFRDGFTCSVFEILDSHWLCDEVTSITTYIKSLVFVMKTYHYLKLS